MRTSSAPFTILASAASIHYESTYQEVLGPGSGLFASEAEMARLDTALVISSLALLADGAAAWIAALGFAAIVATDYLGRSASVREAVGACLHRGLSGVASLIAFLLVLFGLGIVAFIVVAGATGVASSMDDAVGAITMLAAVVAGIAIVAVACRDLFGSVPAPTPGFDGARAGLVPVAFPTMLTPGVVLLAVAVGADRGVVAAVGVIAVAAAVALVGFVTLPPSVRRIGQGVVGAATVGIGAYVVLDGVYAI